MNSISEIERQEEAAIDALRLKAFETNSDADRQAYFDAVSKWFQDRHIRRVDAERAPFLPVQGAVKKLEWKYVERAVMTYVTSDDRGMLYYINQSFGSDSYYFATVRYSDGTVLYDGDDLPSAKAAAQADYEARVMSTIETVIPVSQPSAARELALEEVTLERGIEQWRNMKPSEVMKGSTAQITYALEDARKDILSLARALSSPDHADAGKVEGDGWLPIESAPKDGTEIIYLTKYGSIGFCRYAVDDINDWFGWWDLQADDEVYPKFWLSRSTLPSAPSEGAE